MKKSVVARHFSRHAAVYDRYADIQAKTAEELSSAIDGRDFRNILEVGCGTGNLTRLLAEKHSRARILAVDISYEMLRIARRKISSERAVFFVAADAEAMQWAPVFDCVVSNACFQWFEDISRALSGHTRALTSGGAIAFSVFGPETFCELQAALEVVLPGVSIDASHFVTEEKIQRYLREDFIDVCVREIKYQEDFSRLEELLKKIKYTGTTGGGFGRRLNRSSLAKIEQAYLKRFGRIRATYQVFFCFGHKP